MIIGGDKSAVIENIKKHVKAGEYNKKAELDDPVLSDEDAEKAIAGYARYRNNKLWYFIKSRPVFIMEDIVTLMHKKHIKVVGWDNLKGIKKGAIITNNHFNPLDSIFPRYVIKKKYHKPINLVAQETNLAMEGFNGYLIYNQRLVPLRKSPNYILRTFIPQIKRMVEAGQFIVIYPEEELWFNYRKPRPCKRGTYLFASQANAPVVPIFIEMQDTNEDDNEQFVKLDYTIHILKPIYPDPKKSHKENSVMMAEQDYAERKEAYELAYGKKLNYKFSYGDIAGYKPGIKTSSCK
jgi:1-acyl-sn-glycerol-3-phosphate acyltransferase